ncbi:MAG: DUF2304 family protein [Spirochaetota bacterium]
MNTVHIERIQYISIAASAVFLLFVIELIRRKRIKEAYGILWLAAGVFFAVLSFWRRGLEQISFAVGIAYPPAALLLFLVAALLLILIQFSIVISKLSSENKKLAQEIALLKLSVENITEQKKPFRRRTGRQ